MTSRETIYPDNGLTNHQRDVLLSLLLEREGLVFERKSWEDQFHRTREEFYLQEMPRMTQELRIKLWKEMRHAYYDLSLAGHDVLIKKHVESVLGEGCFSSIEYTLFCNSQLEVF